MFYELTGLAVFILAVFFFWERQGRKAEQNDQMKRMLDDIKTANRARDRLRHDPAAAKRVRKHFTR